ncbi:MAG TPA: hypothetical protein VGD67_08720 [Pseudonocardiaceae bacterium]
MNDLTSVSAAATQQAPPMPPVELPPLPDRFAPQVAAELGWGGTVLPPMVVLGRRVIIVAELLENVHRDRVLRGWDPVTDRVSVQTWAWPELAATAPDPAVRITGVIASARHWRTALTCAAPFVGISATAMLLPPGPARDAHCLSQAEFYGAAVVATAERDLVDLVQPGRGGRLATAGSTTITRWVHEVVYDRLVSEAL